MPLSTAAKQFQSQLRQFVETNESFKIVYSTHSTPLTPSTSGLCILDSSFNPPHKGHLSLITKSLQHQKGPSESVSVLLLLSVKNADKLVPKPASFEKRLDMMCLLADYIEKTHKVPVSVGLTNHAKFMDKSQAIRGWASQFEAESCLHQLRFIFLIGFDTLIRIFDPKYYMPLSIADALADFMKFNEFFCLTRTDEKNDAIESQIRYVEIISSGSTDLPSEWARKIHLVSGEDEFLNISSSNIRRGSALKEQIWKGYVITTIAEYIERENIY